MTLPNITQELHSRNNRYTRGRHAIPVANNAIIYSTFKDLSIREARVIEETFSITRFPILPLRPRTHWHGLKRRGALNVRSLEALLQSTNSVSFTKKVMAYL